MSKEYIQALNDLFGLVAFRGSFEKAQKKFVEVYPELDFIKVFGKSYL